MAQRGNAWSPVVIALLSWLVPGWGYWLLGQRVRGVIIFISVVSVFLLGILIGGIRVMDPPGWGQFGFKPQIVMGVKGPEKVDPRSAEQETNLTRESRNNLGWAMTEQPVAEIGNKPWSIGQVFTGPMYIASAAIAVEMARPLTANPTEPAVPPSHSRSWELGTLYTAIAGMLNLLAIIDCVFRAAQPAAEKP